MWQYLEYYWEEIRLNKKKTISLLKQYYEYNSIYYIVLFLTIIFVSVLHYMWYILEVLSQ
jgi:hypothetical protein